MAKSLKTIFYLLLAFLIAIDYFFLDRSSSFQEYGFSLDSMTAFFALFAFFGSCVMFLITKIISKFIQVNEEYYNDDF